MIRTTRDWRNIHGQIIQNRSRGRLFAVLMAVITPMQVLAASQNSMPTPTGERLYVSEIQMSYTKSTL